MMAAVACIVLPMPTLSIRSKCHVRSLKDFLAFLTPHVEAACVVLDIELGDHRLKGVTQLGYMHV